MAMYNAISSNQNTSQSYWLEITPEKNENINVSTLPYDFSQSSAVVLNGEIHILGSASNTRYHYKFDGTSWSNVSTLPYDFYYGSAIVYNNEIHIMGSGYSSYTKYHYKWDGTSWSNVSTLPYDFYYGSAVVLNNEIHIMGGSSNTRKHYKWDGSSWSSVSTLPYSFYYGNAVVLNNEIHIMGGDSSSYTNHYSIAQPPSIQGIMPQGSQIYYPNTSSPITNNLQSTTDGYLVTADGEVKISVNKEDLEV